VGADEKTDCTIKTGNAASIWVGAKITILRRAETLPKRIHKADPQMQNILQRGVVIFCLAPHIVRGMN
jgi:hypothetical protein